MHTHIDLASHESAEAVYQTALLVKESVSLSVWYDLVVFLLLQPTLFRANTQSLHKLLCKLVTLDTMNAVVIIIVHVMKGLCCQYSVEVLPTCNGVCM